jgi:hypothetical protein
MGLDIRKTAARSIPEMGSHATIRRSVVSSFVGLLGFMLPLSSSNAWADFPPVNLAENGFVESSNGVKIKDYLPGEGMATKDGDVLRIQFALFLPDGSIVSRFEVHSCWLEFFCLHTLSRA